MSNVSDNSNIRPAPPDLPAEIIFKIVSQLLRSDNAIVFYFEYEETKNSDEYQSGELLPKSDFEGNEIFRSLTLVNKSIRGEALKIFFSNSFIFNFGLRFTHVVNLLTSMGPDSRKCIKDIKVQDFQQDSLHRISPDILADLNLDVMRFGTHFSTGDYEESSQLDRVVAFFFDEESPLRYMMLQIVGAKEVRLEERFFPWAQNFPEPLEKTEPFGNYVLSDTVTELRGNKTIILKRRSNA